MTPNERAHFQSRIVEFFLRLPPHIRRLNHGRHLDDGLDCAGLLILAYESAGIVLSDLDIAYEENEYGGKVLGKEAGQLLAMRLRDVTAHVQSSMDRDGDIWIFETANNQVHLGIFCNGYIFHMGDDIHRRAANRLRPLIHRGFRP